MLFDGCYLVCGLGILVCGFQGLRAVCVVVGFGDVCWVVWFCDLGGDSWVLWVIVGGLWVCCMDPGLLHFVGTVFGLGMVVGGCIDVWLV